MDYQFGADERATFKACRRRWELGAPHRRNLVPAATTTRFDLQQAVKDALAVYYFPGLWDWQRAIVLPLVRKALLRSVREQGGSDADTEVGTALLERYLVAAPMLENFSPIRIDTDVEATLADPRQPDQGLLTPDNRRVRFAGRVDLLAVDADDAYWVVRHRVVPEWLPLDALLLDEEAVAACWLWEQCYLGMEIAGTIHNELRTSALAEPPAVPLVSDAADRGGIDQNEASGGGRSIPQHRRLYGRPRQTGSAIRIEQMNAGPVRRTRIRRSRAEIESMGTLLGVEALQMTAAEVALYPAPTAANCADCAFVAPCLAMSEGADPEPVLAAGYRPRPVDEAPKPRLGGQTWSTGRGGAPPTFRGRPPEEPP